MRVLIMKKMVLGLLVAACLSVGLHAEAYDQYGSASNNYFAGFDSACRRHSTWNFGGHLDGGLYANAHGQKNTYDMRSVIGHGIDPYSGNTDLLLNVRQSDAQLNQGVVFAERQRGRHCGWDWGTRVDYAFGTDARYLQSAGLEFSSGHGRWGSGDYYSALAQAYGEVGYGNLGIKIGKFLTPMGSDPVLSPDRFFYSLSKNFGILPVTHTGVLATLDVNRKLSVFAGWTQGENEFFESSENNAVLAGFEYAFNPCTKIGYSFMAGSDTYATSDWTNVTYFLGDTDYFVNALYLKHKFNCKWDYTFEWVWRNMDGDNGGYYTYGINNSLYYTFNSKWAAGFRMEWLHTNGGMGQMLGIGENDTYGLVLGANWKPCCWFTLKPEIRYDSVHGDPGPFGLVKNNWNGKSDQFSGGFSAVVTF